MKNFFWWTALVVGCIVVNFFSTGERETFIKTIQKQSAQLEHEKMFNARRMRRLKYMDHPEHIDLEAVALAFHINGTKPSMVASMLYCENGPPDSESGSLDKTDFFTQFQGVQRSALEGSRTLNRMAWNWLSAHPQTMRQMLLESSSEYTNMGPTQQRLWAENLIIANDKFSRNIGWANRGVLEPLKMMRPTPTPVYNFADSPQKAKGKPKYPSRRKKL